MMVAEGAVACKECGTEGGYADHANAKPLRRHGYCHTCYMRHYINGDITVAKSCLACGQRLSLYARSLCHRCYARAQDQGIADRYPECGAVPVPRLVPSGEWPIHPAPWPHLNDVEATGRMLWHDAEGNRKAHALFAYRPDIAELNTAAEQDAAAWLRSHPEQVLVWDRPEYAMSPATEPIAA